MSVENFAETMLANINRLSDTAPNTEIKPLSAATFPGTHCPLMGALMAIRSMKDALFVVVGSDECTFYTQCLTEMSIFEDVSDRFISVVLDDNDITFGSIPKVRRCFKQIENTDAFNYVVLVTTCLNELIGDDFEGCIDELEDILQKRVLLVHTEHFSCQDHIPGIERTWEVLADLMERKTGTDTFNILGDTVTQGQRQDLAILCNNMGGELGAQLTGSFTIEDIRIAGNARANLVFNASMLPLAKRMQEKFGQPYFYFASTVDPDIVLSEYTRLFSSLGKAMPDYLERQYQACKDAEAAIVDSCSNYSYIYGHSQTSCMALNAYLCRLGLKPLLIQTNGIKQDDAVYRDEVLKYANPYICQSANMMAMNVIYKELKPTLFIGMEFQGRLGNQGIQVINTMNLVSGIGFTGIQIFLENIAKTLEKVDVGGK